MSTTETTTVTTTSLHENKMTRSTSSPSSTNTTTATTTTTSTTSNRKMFERNWDDLNKPKLAIIGSCFSIATMATFFPFELAKTRLQSSQFNTFPAKTHITPTMKTSAPHIHAALASSITTTATKATTAASTATTKAFPTGLASTATATATVVHPVVASTNHHQQQQGRLFPLLKEIYATNGAKGLFRGFWTAAIGNCLVEWVYYASYETTRQKLQKHFVESLAREQAITPTMTQEEMEEIMARNSLVKESVAGALSESTCETIAIPFDVVAQRLMIQEMGKTGFSYKGGLDAVRQIYKTEGIRGFFKGFGASLLTHAPESAIWWIIYMHVKKELYLNQPESWVEQSAKQGSFLIHLTAGTVAGGLTATFCNPFDVVKTRLQVQNSKSAYRYRNFLHALRMIPRQEGLSAFTNGMFAKILYMAPVSGLHIALYELVKRMSSGEEHN